MKKIHKDPAKKCFRKGGGAQLPHSNESSNRTSYQRIKFFESEGERVKIIVEYIVICLKFKKAAKKYKNFPVLNETQNTLLIY